MPIFIVLCLSLAVVIQTENPFQKTLLHPVFWYVGLAIAIIAILGNFLKKLPELLSYDLFSSGTLLAWFSLWKPLFVKDSPIFFYFPVYFAVITAIATLFFMSQSGKIDQANLQLMQAIVTSGAADPWMVMVVVLITLYFDNHFLQYPIMMTLLTTRFTLSGCLIQNSPKN